MTAHRGLALARAATTPLYGYRRYALANIPSLVSYIAGTPDTALRDLSGSGNNLTAAGSPSVGGNADSPIHGEDHSTDSNGSSHYYTSSFDPFTNGVALSVGVWFRRNAHATLDDLWGSSGNVRFYLDAGNQDLVLRPDNHGPTESRWTAAISGDNVWNLIGLTFDEGADSAIAYVNGSSLGTITQTRQYATGNFQFMASGGGFQPTDGKWCHAFVSNSIVNATLWGNLYTMGAVGSL